MDGLKTAIRRAVISILGAGGVVGLPGLLQDALGVGSGTAETITEGAVALVVALILLAIPWTSPNGGEEGDSG